MNSILVKTKELLFCCSFGIIALISNSYGQKYYEIYPLAPIEVQNKMNENKMNQISILEGIYSHHTLTCSSPLFQNKEALLIELKERKEIIYVDLKSDSQTIYVVCNSTLTTNELLDYFTEKGLTIVHRNVIYSTKAD